MMNQKAFWTGICGIVLVFGMLFAGCANGTQEVEGTVNAPSAEPPVVTATAVPGGVKLEWSPIVDINTYQVWRRTDATEDKQLGGSAVLDVGTNKYYYLDIISDTNGLAVDTAYTYTVVAVSSSATLTNGRGYAFATPTDIPARDTKVAAPKDVVLTLDPEAKTITVSWTAGEGIPTSDYRIDIRRDNSGATVNGEWNGSTYINTNQSNSLSSTSRIYSWPENFQVDGIYTVQVSARALSRYYKTSDIGVSARNPFESLFTTTSITSGGGGITDTNSRITDYYGSVSLSGISRPGVTYTLERAPADSVGNVTGDYASFRLSRNGNTQESVVSGDLTADILGNLPVSTVYDRSLDLRDGESYKYRVIATKGDRTQRREAANFITIDSRDYFWVNVSINNPTPGTNTQAYEVSIPYVIKDALKVGDAVVVYYVKGNPANLYQTGPYEEFVRFTKEDLDRSGGVTPKTVTIAKLTSAPADNYAFVQAYVEYADGRPRRDLAQSNLTVAGGTPNSYTSGGSTIWYYQLNY
jgi:hypothetical protein